MRRPRRYMFATLKGGVAKTTSAWLMCWWLVGQGHTVVAIDADYTNQGLSDCYELAGGSGSVPFLVMRCRQGEDLYELAKRLMAETGADRLVIDGGGEDENRLARGCLAVDQIVCPVRPNPADVRRLPHTYNVVQLVADAGHPIDMAVLFTQVSRVGQGPAAIYRNTLNEDQVRAYCVMPDEIPHRAPYMRVWGADPEGEYGAYAQAFAWLESGEHEDQAVMIDVPVVA